MKINFLKGQSNTLVHICLPKSRCCLSFLKNVSMLRILPDMSTFSPDFNSLKLDPHCGDEAGRICNQVWVCHTEWIKSKRENHISCINAYMWNLEKCYWWTYLQGRNRDIDNRYVDTVGEGDGGMNWEWNWHIHTIVCKTDG